MSKTGPSNPHVAIDVAVIGAGPAGLMAAEYLAARGRRVRIYDRMPSPGRKFLMAGRGGLNLTHSEPLPQFLTRYTDLPDQLRAAIETFPPDALRAWCEGLGETTFVGSSGRVFPRSFKASPLLRAWLRRLDQLGVEFFLRHSWRGFTKDGGLSFDSGQGAVDIRADAVLLALGGASWPRLGADGAWTDILAGNAVGITPLQPANSGFLMHWSPLFTERFAGTPLKTCQFTMGSKSVRGEAIITAQGMEGSAIYALSAALRAQIAHAGAAELTIDLKPDLSVEILAARFAAQKAKQSMASKLRKLGLPPVAIALLREVAGTQWPGGAQALAQLIKTLPLHVTGSAGLARAISTAGGIAFDELEADFMLRRLPGIFAAGVMLDWDAPTGGYLLQASMATGVAAARGIDARLEAGQARRAGTVNS